MCFCWTSTHGFGPVWIFRSKEYHEYWTAVHSRTDGLGTVKVKLWSTTGLGSVRTARLADIQFNPLVEARDLIPFPPPPECGWQEWCYIHKIDFIHRKWCHAIAEYWWRISPTDHQGLLVREKMTEDNAVLFCWINGNSYKKHSTTHLVHYHLVSTYEKMTLKKHSCRKQVEIMHESLDSFRSDVHLYIVKHRCAGCLEQCYGFFSVFAKDASKCAIAQKLVSENTGQNPIVMNACYCEVSPEEQPSPLIRGVCTAD